MARKKKEDNRSPRQIIVDMCPLLESFGVTQIVCDYEGADFDGTVHSMNCEYGERDERNAPYPQYASRGTVINDSHVMSSISSRQLREVLNELTYSSTPDQPALLAVEEAEKFKTAIRNLLPAEWTHDAGSYGDMIINVLAGTITINHTKRVIQEERQTINFNRNAELPTTVSA